MVPPKPAKSAPKPAKAAAKPAGNAAPPQESIFAAMKKQGALAKNMAKAKKVVAVREFDGPDGDYLCNLNRVSHYTKVGTLGIVLEYRVIEEGEAQGQKMVIFYSFKSNEYKTIQEIQNEFYETLQLMGLETDIDDEQLDADLKKLISDRTVITVRMKTSTGGKSKGKKFASVVGLASAAKEVEATEYQEEVPDDQAIAEMAAAEAENAPTDEWEEVPEEVPEEVEEVSDPALPSSWVGYAMVYKGAEVEVLEADDTAMKCVIKSAEGKKLKVAFSSLAPPAE